jgi:nitroreductase
MQLEEAIFNRRSVREYTAEAIDDATIKSLIAAAVQAPNAVNEQPWTFTVVRDRRVLEQLSCAAKLHACDNITPRDQGLSLGTRRSAV